MKYEMFSAESLRSALVLGDVPSIVREIQQTDKTILIITPLLEDKFMHEKHLGDPQTHIRRVLEAEASIRTGEIKPDVIVVEGYEVIRETGLLTKVLNFISTRKAIDSSDTRKAIDSSKTGNNPVIIFSVSSPSEDEVFKSFPILECKKRKEVFEVSAKNQTERMALILALTKIKPVRGICIVVPTNREKKRMEIFLSIFGVQLGSGEKPSENKKGANSVSIYTPDDLGLHNHPLVLDLSLQVPNIDGVLIRVGDLTPTPSPKNEKFAGMLQRTMEYKYRIESALSLITPRVIQGKNKIDPNIVKHLKGMFRARI